MKFILMAIIFLSSASFAKDLQTLGNAVPDVRKACQVQMAEIKERKIQSISDLEWHVEKLEALPAPAKELRRFVQHYTKSGFTKGDVEFMLETANKGRCQYHLAYEAYIYVFKKMKEQKIEDEKLKNRLINAFKKTFLSAKRSTNLVEVGVAYAIAVRNNLSNDMKVLKRERKSLRDKTRAMSDIFFGKEDAKMLTDEEFASSKKRMLEEIELSEEYRQKLRAHL